jgi:uncharacterized protein with PQ loop repeat
MFETILRICFLASLITTFVYLVKVYKVVKWHKSDRETYIREAKPFVTQSKIFNLLTGILLLSCGLVFIMNGARVCSGWYLKKS